VYTDDDGGLAYDSSASAAGATVTLRFDMDALVILHTCPHPLNPATEYPHKPLKIEFFSGEPADENDYCLNFRPENRRALDNTRLYYLDPPFAQAAKSA